MSKRLLISLLILFLVLGGGGYVLFRSGKLAMLGRMFRFGSAEGPGEAGEEGGEEAGEEFSCAGEVYTNTRQGYKVCYPSGWVMREFGYSQLSVGFDPRNIPEASEYGGMFMISVSRKSSAALSTEYSDGLESIATVAATVDGIAGTKLSGTIPSDFAFFPNYRQVYVLVENLSRTYAIQLLSPPDDYAANVLLYDEFVGSLRFLAGTASPPWSSDIWLSTPWPGDEVSGTFRIAGEAQGAFENTLVARLKTTGGEVLFENPITYASSEVGGLGYFDVEMTYSTTSSSGTLEVFHTSPKDGSVVDLVSVPLSFSVP